MGKRVHHRGAADGLVRVPQRRVPVVRARRPQKARRFGPTLGRTAAGGYFSDGKTLAGDLKKIPGRLGRADRAAVRARLLGGLAHPALCRRRHLGLCDIQILISQYDIDQISNIDSMSRVTIISSDIAISNYVEKRYV